MTEQERVSAYINSLDAGHTPFLEELERRAREAHVPILRRETQSFLKVLLTLCRPGRILEVGSAVGFSAILMAEYGEPDAQITTIENDERRISAARENFAASGHGDRITLLAGDAAGILPALEGPYEFILMDAAKGQYIRFLPETLRLLRSGGVLLTDNVLQGGDVLESRFLVERRNRTIHRRMREYLYALTHEERLRTSILPLGDGVAVSVRTGGEPDEGEKK